MSRDSSWGKPGTMLTGGNTVLLWLVILSAIAGVESAYKVFTAPVFWGFLVLDVVSLFALLGYRTIKAKVSTTGFNIEAGDG